MKINFSSQNSNMEKNFTLNPKTLKRLFFIFVVVVALIIASFIFIERVPEGRVAVVYTPSGGATKVLDPGWHFVGLFEKTQEYPTRITILQDQISVTSSDGKKLVMPVRYEMKVDKSKVIDIFKALGSQNIEQIQQGYLYQKLYKSAREVISQYSVLDIYGTKASEASAKVTEKMAAATADLGFLVTDVTLGTPEVDAETQQMIDATVQAAQANTLKKQELENERIEAEKKKVIAEGEAQAKLIQAQAEAEANRLIAESITKELIDMKEAEARLKHGWITVQGAEAVITDTKQ